MKTAQHIPVAVSEVLDCLGIQSDDCVYDGTLGSCGHSFEIAGLLKIGKGILLCGDVDMNAIENARLVLSPYIQSGLGVYFFHNSFSEIVNNELFSSLRPNKILLDLGWSMDQFQNPERGFSFSIDGPLDMRLEFPSTKQTAADILNTASEQEIVDILFVFGEESHARKIAKKIIQIRSKHEFKTTFDLVRAIEMAGVRKISAIHPATKTFQALRIAVNHEFQELFDGLPRLIDALPMGGRMCIITFHSSEDRIVKQIFSRYVSNQVATLVHKKIITPSRNEIIRNPRSRSAKLRTIQKII